MHIDSKSKFYIHIFAMVKLEKKKQKFESGETGKKGVFCNFFKVQ